MALMFLFYVYEENAGLHERPAKSRDTFPATINAQTPPFKFKNPEFFIN